MKGLGFSFFSVVILGLAQAPALASGFLCEGSGFTAQLHNDALSTRLPAVLVIGDDQADPVTLLQRTGEEIQKSNRTNTVRYVVQGTPQLDAEQAILQIAFKEGRETLESGETVPAQLILVREGKREVFQLGCERYLKSNR